MPTFYSKRLKKNVTYRKKFRLPKGKRKKAPQASTAVATMGYSSGLRIYPKKFTALMRYKIPFTIAAPTVDTWNNTHFWSATNVFDPDTTGIGTSSTLFAQLAAQYNHFTVLSSKFKFTGNLRAGNAMILAVTNQDDTITTLGTTKQRLNDTNTKTKLLTNENPDVTLYSSYNRAKVFQKSKYDDLVGTATSGPAENHYFALASTNLGGALAPSIIDGVLEIVYRVLWSEQKEDPNI